MSTASWLDSLATLHGAYSENTIRAYRADFEIFERWCGRNGFASLPALPETVAAYVEAMGGRKAPANIQRSVVAVGRIHRLVGHASPAAADVVALALRRMLRARGRRQKQAAGLDAALRDRLLEACDDDLGGMRDRALIAVGYDTLCRRSELVALRAEDIEHFDDGDGSVLIRRSKTDQAGEGRLGYLSSQSMLLVAKWLDASRIDVGPLFRAVRGSTVGTRQLSPMTVNRTLKKLALRAALDEATAQRLSGHSMRVGAALDMVANGVDLVPIMHAGGWKSPGMVLRYSQQIELTKSGMARLYALKRH